MKRVIRADDVPFKSCSLESPVSRQALEDAAIPRPTAEFIEKEMAATFDLAAENRRLAEALRSQTEELNRLRAESAQNRAHQANAEGLRRELDALKAQSGPRPPSLTPKPASAAVPPVAPSRPARSLSEEFRCILSVFPPGTRIKIRV